MSAFSLCLSAATILRCPSLSRFQYIVSIIPTVLEVIFTSSLAVIFAKSGNRRHLLLTSEGLIYFLLTILDLLSHILFSARTNVNVFAGFDVAIGVSSFVPLFFYTFFLYLYANSELLSNSPSLPRILAKISSLLLLLSIPAIIIANEVAAFAGIRRIALNGGILIGFESRDLFTINAFFSALTMALLIVFQAIVFLISFFRLIIALLNQRKFQASGKDAAHLVNGVAWLSVGMKLGAIESVIAFGGGGFGLVLTRRLIRFLSRAFLCIGIVKGPDAIEDFRAVRKEMADSNNLRTKFYQGDAPAIRAMISNPRQSTFQQLSPMARTFYSLPRAHLFPESSFDFNKDEKKAALKTVDNDDDEQDGDDIKSVARTPNSSTMPRLRSLQELQGIAAFANLKEEVKKKQQLQKEKEISQLQNNENVDSGEEGRVTVGYRNSNGAPTLLLRFSTGSKFPFPSPSGIIESVRSTFSESQFKRMSEGSFAEKQYQRQSGISYATTQEPDPVTYLRPNVSTLPRSMENLKAPTPAFMNSGNNSNRNSMTPSIADSGVEIINAPQRTVSQKSARAMLYNVNSPASDEAGPNSAPPSPPKLQFATTLTESPVVYLPEDGASATATAATPGKPRVVSEYSLADQSGADTLKAVRELTKQFPGPPVTYNGRPLMAGLGQNIYDDSSGSPTMIGDHNRDGFQPGPYKALPAPPPAAVTRGRGAALSMVSRQSAYSVDSVSEYSYDVDLEAARGQGRARATSRFDTDSEYEYESRSVSRVGSRPRLAVTTTTTANAVGDAGERDGDRDRLGPGGTTGKTVMMQTNPSLATISSSFIARTLDPFRDDGGSPIYSTPPPPLPAPLPKAKAVPKPIGLPSNPKLRTTANANYLAAPPSHPISAPTSPEDVRPISTYTLSSPFAKQTPLQDGGDPFSELAVRTGGSMDLRKSGGGMSISTAMARSNWPVSVVSGLPTPPVDSVLTVPTTTKDPNLGFATSQRPRRPPSRITWIIDGEPQVQSLADVKEDSSEDTREASMNEERRRQVSIDAAAQALTSSIPWLKNPEIEEEERQLAKALAASRLKAATQKAGLSKIKSIGNVKQRTTPPVIANPAAARTSLYIESIMIPKQSPYPGRVQLVQTSGSPAV